MRNLNDVLALTVELAALLTIAGWGGSLFDSLIGQVGGAFGFAVLFGLAWGFFAAANSPTRLEGVLLIGFKLAVFGAAALALRAVGLPGFGAALMLAASAHLILALSLRRL